jgi:hypothetical protein
MEDERHSMVRSVAVGARHIDDDVLEVTGWIGFEGDSGEGAEEEVGGVGHDGGATRADFVTGLELIEFAEGMVDVGGGAEFLDVADERGGEVGLVEILLEQSGVFGAEAGVRIRNGHAATTATSRALLTMRQNGCGSNGRARVFGIHEGSFRVE